MERQETKIPSGTQVMDFLLDGGYEKDVLTCIYGSPGSGKTNLVMLCMVNSVLASKKKVVYIDTEGNFSVARLQQLCSNVSKEELAQVMQSIIVLKPTNFEEQAKAFEKLRQIVDERKIGLIVLDSAAMLYRLELGKNRDVYAVNREFGVQLSYLAEIARRKNIPVIVTNQVYADLDDNNNTKIVGGDILRYASKCLIELQRLSGGNRLVILKKHRSLPDDRKMMFRITETGIEEVEENNTPKSAVDFFPAAGK
jgi:DNA repair protein RadB